MGRAFPLIVVLLGGANAIDKRVAAGKVVLGVGLGTARNIPRSGEEDEVQLGEGLVDHFGQVMALDLVLDGHVDDGFASLVLWLLLLALHDPGQGFHRVGARFSGRRCRQCRCRRPRRGRSRTCGIRCLVRL